MNVGRRWLLTAAIVGVGATMSLAIACSSSSKKNNNTPEPTAMTTPSGTPSQTTAAGQTPGGTMTPSVHIGEKQYSITGLNGAAIESPTAGSVTFEVHNTGTVEHVFYVFKTNTDPANLPLSGDTVDEAKLGGTIGEIDPVPAGSIKTLTINLQPGKYVLICNRPGHYKLGMHAAFTVQ